MKHDSAVKRKIGKLAAQAGKECFLGLLMVRLASPDYAPDFEQLEIGGLLEERGNPRGATLWQLVAEAAPEKKGEALAAALEPLAPQLGARLEPGQEAVLAELTALLSGVSPEDVRELLWRFYGEKTEGKNGGFSLGEDMLKLLLSFLELRPGSCLYDPCGGLLTRCSRAADVNLSFCGQAGTAAAYALSLVEGYLQGIQVSLGEAAESALRADLHPGRKFDAIVANPPFNQAGWAAEDGLEGDARWRFGCPPRSNGNFAWLQHVASHLDESGHGAVLLPNGTLTTTVLAERTIREGLLASGMVEAVIAMPAGAAGVSTVPCCVWLLSGGRKAGAATLLVDAQRLRAEGENLALLLTGLIHRHRNGLISGRTDWYAVVEPAALAEKGYLLSPNFYTAQPELSLEGLQQGRKKFLSLLAELEAPLSGSSLGALLGQWRTARPSRHWTCAPISALYEISGGLAKERGAYGHGVAMADVATVVRYPILPETLTSRVEATAEEVEKFSIRRGDVLLNRTSETIQELACGCVAAEDREGVFGSYLKRLRPLAETTLEPMYAAAYFQSGLYRLAVERVSPVYTTRANINVERLAQLPVYYPEKAMQQRLGETFQALHAAQRTAEDPILAEKLKQAGVLLVEQFITYPVTRLQREAKL